MKKRTRSPKKSRAINLKQLRAISGGAKAELPYVPLLPPYIPVGTK